MIIDQDDKSLQFTISTYIHLQRAFLPIDIVTFSYNFKDIVCVIVAFVFAKVLQNHHDQLFWIMFQ